MSEVSELKPIHPRLKEPVRLLVVGARLLMKVRVKDVSAMSRVRTAMSPLANCSVRVNSTPAPTVADESGHDPEKAVWRILVTGSPIMPACAL